MFTEEHRQALSTIACHALTQKRFFEVPKNGTDTPMHSYLAENQNLAYKLVKKAHINHISLDLFFLIRKNYLKAGVKYAQDYWPNKAACIERRRFPRNDSRHKQAKK